MKRQLKIEFYTDGKCDRTIKADHIDVCRSMTIITIIDDKGEWKTLNVPDEFIDFYIHSGIIVIRYPGLKTLEIMPIEVK